MNTRLVFTVIALFLFCAPANALGPEETSCHDCLSVDQAQKDLRFLFDTLKQEHVDLFARRSRADYENHIDHLVGSITAPVPKSEFNIILQDAMAYGRIAHAKTEAIFDNVFAHIGQGGKIIPLSITYRGGALVTDNWADESDALPPGSQILSLGGMSVADFEQRLRKMISADTDRLFRAQIELGMPAYVYLVFGPVDSLAVTYMDGERKTVTHTVAAIALNEMYALQDERALPRPERDPNARIYRSLGEDIAYLQPGPFFANEDEKQEEEDSYAIAAFKNFVEKAFAEIAESGAQDLIIDMRFNPGGDLSFSDLIVARLVDAPFRFASRYDVRAGSNTKKKWADRSADTETLLGRLTAAIASAEAGERVTIDLPETQPITSHAFKGNVWVLIDKHSYSNAAVVAALMQDLDIATIMGEETADLPTTYGAVEHFTLPNSGASITYPKAYMIRPSGSEEVRGVVPDIAFATNPIGSERDIVLDSAVETIIQKRPAAD